MNERLMFLLGYCELEITGASPQWALNRLFQQKIMFWNLKWIDTFTIHIRVRLSVIQKAEKEIIRAMCSARILRKDGLRLRMHQILKRPVLVIMFLLSALGLTYLSSHVLFYCVNGNETVPDEVIIRAMQDTGFGFGIFGVDMKPQHVKDHLLNTIPELQWLTVVQNGCRAEILVRERTEKPEVHTRKGFGHIVASKSGVISSQSIYAGESLVNVGDAVLEGELLVSGIVDLERIHTLKRADAEIFALTQYRNRVAIPSDHMEKTGKLKSWNCIWLTIGEKRIKLFGDSGIYTADCDKMMKTKYLTLPGNLRLPVSYTVETYTAYETAVVPSLPTASQLLLEEYVTKQIRHQMHAGEILNADYVFQTDHGCHVLTSSVTCQEMIALPVEADWMEEEWSYDRTHSKR